MCLIEVKVKSHITEQFIVIWPYNKFIDFRSQQSIERGFKVKIQI